MFWGRGWQVQCTAMLHCVALVLCCVMQHSDRICGKQCAPCLHNRLKTAAKKGQRSSGVKEGRETRGKLELKLNLCVALQPAGQQQQQQLPVACALFVFCLEQ